MFVFDGKVREQTVFDLEELDGKHLEMRVVKVEGLITVAGYDGDKVYIILQQREV